MKHSIFLSLIIAFALTSFMVLKSDFFSVPENWPSPEYDFSKNPLTKEKIELGRALFYDPILSRDSTISCTSCHSQYTAFTHVDHDLSHGIDDRIGKRNSPALMNLAWQKKFMWDGSVNHLDVQALAPISNPDEMGENIQHVVQKLQRSGLYPQLFYKAFGDSLITGQHLLKSLSQFMLTFVSANSKYDKVMRNEIVFTEQEKNGYQLFKKNCAACHKEPLFSTYEFANNGLPLDTTLNDFGRMSITHSSTDSLKFKIPSLRNIEFSYPYMHDGRFKTIPEVILHYTSGVQGSKTLDPKLKNSISLTSNERVDLYAFLLTLTDKTFLFNRAFSYPKDFFLPKTKDVQN